MAVSRINSPFLLPLPESPTTPDPKLYEQLLPIYQSLQTLQQALTTFTGNVPPFQEYWDTQQVPETIFPEFQNRLFPIFSQNVSAGAMINLWNDAGTLKARNANATDNTKPAWGYAPAAVVSPARGEVVIFNGLCQNIGGMTPAQRYWLHTVDGQIINAAPVAAGNIEQVVGVALASTLLYFMPALDFIQH